jgi:hypothetical protein
MLAAGHMLGSFAVLARLPGWATPAFWVTLTLVGVLLLGAVVLAGLDRWRRRAGPAPPSASDQLAHFRELYEQGDISQAEFERIRATLNRQLQAELQAGSQAAGQAGDGQLLAPESGKTDGPSS